MEYIITKNDSDELMHYGVKGMKWGVRRYQNKDGTLTPSGKRKAVMDDYKKIGASKQLQRSHGYDRWKEAKINNETTKALKRLSEGENDPKYSAKQRAKDYEKAIRGLNSLKGQPIVDTYYDADRMRFNTSKITKLQSKKQSERIQRKIKQLTTDNDLMQLKVVEASEKYKQYATVTNQLINRMTNDKSVTYRTRERIHSSAGGDEGYMTTGTDYVVRANTKRRAKSKKYTDEQYKKQYDPKITKYTTVYY